MINYHVFFKIARSHKLLKAILQECFDLSLLLLFPKFLDSVASAKRCLDSGPQSA